MGTEIKAAIDIGSNTVLLLIGKPGLSKVDVLREEQTAPRLGKGVDAEKNLQPDSVNRVIKTLQEYKLIIEEYNLQVSEVAVVATSAVRDASNRQHFIDRVLEETGFATQILSGEEEAKYTFLGAQSVLQRQRGPLAVIDIGGGSTEVAVGEESTLEDRFSFNIGSVRFTERYLKHNPPSENELQNCRNTIAETLEKRSFALPDQVNLIGVAGTVTSLAHIRLGLKEYSPERINGQKITLEYLSSMTGELASMSSIQILEAYPKILKGREDVIAAGLLILEGFMNAYRIDKLTVSTGGIRHGALLAVQK